MKPLILTAAASLALAACAPNPDAVAPVSMVGAYAGTSCAQAAQLLEAERQTLATLTKKQNDARAADAIVGILGGVILMAATSRSYEGELAASKGKVQALEARLSGCR